MPYRSLSLFVPCCLLSLAAMAQDAAPAGKAQALKLDLEPASAASAAYRDHASAQREGGDSPFKFKQRASAQDMPPPGIPGQTRWQQKAPLAGRGQIGPDGRPPIDCERTPMDHQCR